MFCIPLVVTKTAAAAFHDKLVLFVCCASLRFHTGNLHSYSKTLAFIVSSTDTANHDFKSTLKLCAYVCLDARATMDLDATIKGANVSLTDVETIISNIIAIPIDDGVSFYIKRISEIMEKADYPGVRVSMETKFDGVTTPLSPYRPINHSLQKLEAFQSVLHVVFILCYTVL